MDDNQFRQAAQTLVDLCVKILVNRGTQEELAKQAITLRSVTVTKSFASTMSNTNTLYTLIYSVIVTKLNLDDDVIVSGMSTSEHQAFLNTIERAKFELEA